MKRLYLFLWTALVLIALSSCSRSEKVASSPIDEAVFKVDVDSIKVYIDDLVSFHTRHTLSTRTDPSKGIGAAVGYIVERCAAWAQAAPSSRPRPRVEVVGYRVGENGGRYDRVLTAPEVMVTLPGTKDEREILLLAHLDTRVGDVMDSTSFAPGADDDGSGVACLLETVRILSQYPLEQTVRCLFVSGEEQGLDGSRHFASKAKEEGWRVAAVLSNDMIGNTRASGTLLREDHKVRVFSESRSGEDTPSRQLARYIREMAGRYVPGQEVVLNYRSDRYRRGGDHSSFLREGFTAVRITEYCEDYERTHQDVRTVGGVSYGDLPEWVDLEYLARNIRINIASVMSLALAPAVPENALIANARELDNNTILKWDPVPGTDGKPDREVSYQILCRETSSPEWLPALPMGLSDIVPGDAPMEFSCPLSKDNYYFAVRAVSRDGIPGLPAVAR